MEKYSKAASGMYSWFKETHPMRKYIGRLVNFYGKRLEVVGCSYDELANEPLLIVDASTGGDSTVGGWTYLEPQDVVFKICDAYCYASINDLID